MSENGNKRDLAWKLWIYTNFDCNLSCSYCVAESTPRAPRRAIGLPAARRLVNEALELGCQEVFFTGGEPFILDEIYDMLAYSSARLRTTVLTNAMLFNGKRLARLKAVRNPQLRLQVSLDGGRPQDHDAYRGPGTWAKTVAGIRTLLESGFQVRLSTTETPANSEQMEALHALRRRLGIAEADHFIRPLARRGFSDEGMDVDSSNLAPELTVTRDGVYWHPLASPGSDDLLVTRQIFPLAAAVACIEERLQEPLADAPEERVEFT